MPSNNRRIFYPIEQVSFAPDGTNNWVAAHGAQSVGITTTFNLEQAYELGQLAIYDNLEQIPDVEVTMTKNLDGRPLIYHLATQGSVSATLVGRSAVKTNVALSVFSDTLNSSSGTPLAEVTMSGMVVSSLTYTFPVDGFCNESVTLVGNNKVWRASAFTTSGTFLDNADGPASGLHVQRRSDVLFTLPSGGTPKDANGQYIALTTILPTDIDGITASGTNPPGSTGNSAHVQGITISADLGRDQILELGRLAPYFRYATFPIEVTTEITTLPTQWDNISATEAGGNNGAGPGLNLRNQSIRVYTGDGTFISTGTKNKLASVAWGGGDAAGGGGNVTLTYRYTTFNDLTVMHPADPSALSVVAV